MKNKGSITKVCALFMTLILVLSNFSQSVIISASGYKDVQNQTEQTEQQQDQSASEFVAGDGLSKEVKTYEVSSRREETAKHFYLGNGLYQAVSYVEPVHRKDANGVWQDIDNRLLLTEDQRYATPDGRTTFSTSIDSSTDLISIREDGYRIAMTPALETSSAAFSLEVSNHKQRTAFTTDSDSVDSLARISNTTTARYKDVFSETDIEYILSSNDIKENIIVKNRQEAYEYLFILRIDNLKAILAESGDILLLDIKTGEQMYVLPAPYMFDAHGQVSDSVRYVLAQEDDRYTIRITADKEWINEESRAFPVTIDPTITASSSGDTYIYSQSPDTNYGTWTTMWLSSTRIPFIKCLFPIIPLGCQFVSASLNVYYYYYDNVTSGSLQAGAYQVVHSWNETGAGGLTWNIASPSTTTYISSTQLSTEWFPGSVGAYASTPALATFDVTDAAASWFTTPSTNKGIALRYLTGTNGSVILKSRESGSTYQPYFVISYREPQITSGVYKIKNAANGLYLDVTDGGYTAGTTIQQWSGTSTDNNPNQLFKITFVRTHGTTEQLNYYTIRPMTNSGLGLETSLSGTVRPATVESISTDDEWANLLYNHLWAITKVGSNYAIKNGNVSVASYLTAPANSTNGAAIYTTDTLGSTGEWILEPYTGNTLNGVNLIQSTNGLMVDESYTYIASMYSSLIGVNGPAKYMVREDDYSMTDRATINTNTGVILPVEGGPIKVGFTFTGVTTSWWVNVNVFFEDGIIHTLHNTVSATDVLIRTDTAFLNQIRTTSYSSSKTTCMWKFLYAGNGYYKILNDVTGFYLTAPSNNTNGSKIIESVYNNDYSLWKIQKTSDNHFTLQSKNQYERITDTPLYLAVDSFTSLASVVQSTANILWDVKPLIMRLNVRIDRAFICRYGEQYNNYLHSIFQDNSAGNSIASVFKENYGISVRPSYISDLFSTYPYTQNCTCANLHNIVCYDCMMQGVNDPITDCHNDFHHKKGSKFITGIEGVNLSASSFTTIVFTGQIACSVRINSLNNTSEHKEYYANGESRYLENRIIVFPHTTYDSMPNGDFDGIIETVAHEILHTLNVGHCNNICIMQSSSNKPEIVYKNLTMCPLCQSTANSYKFYLYNQQ